MACKEDTDLSLLKKQRQYVRQKITRISNIVSEDLYLLSSTKINSYHDNLKSLKVEVVALDMKIYTLEDDLNDEDYMISTEEYEEKIENALASLNLRSSLDSNQGGGGTSHSTKLKLPEIALPIFSNDKGECLHKFFYALESIIDKHSLSDYEKFVYLQGQLAKSPRLLIESLDAGDQGYAKAKQLLTEAFASPLTQKYDAIKRLVLLKLEPFQDPYPFISEMRSLISWFDKLKINSSDILQYFIWHAMNDLFQSQFVNITNKAKPDLEQIKSNVFEAAERYIKINERKGEGKARNRSAYPRYTDSTSKNVTTLATNVSRNSHINCHLCTSGGKTNASHRMRDCNVYSTPKSKVDKLRTLRYCIKCSFKNHATDKCRFVFSSKCSHCKGDHMSFLCLASGKTQSNVASVSWVQAMKTSDSGKTLLPTLTIDVQNH